MASSAEAHDSPSRELSLVAGTLALSPDRRAEIAFQLGGGVSALPGPERTVLLPDAGTHSSFWSAAQRPVLTLLSTPHEVRLSVFASLPARGLTLRERLAAGVVPDAVLRWRPEPHRSHVPATGAAKVLQDALFARLRDENFAEGTRLTSMDGITALGIDARRIAELADGLLRDDTLDQLLAAFRLDEERAAVESGDRTARIAAVLRGDRDADTLPDSIHIPSAGMRRALIEGVLAEPEGNGLWSRWRRIPHRRPRLAAALTVIEALAASALVFAALNPPQDQPLTTVQWVIAGILALDVATDAILLTALRRRRQEGKEKPRSGYKS